MERVLLVKGEIELFKTHEDCYQKIIINEEIEMAMDEFY